MSKPLSLIKLSILDDLWNSDSDKFDELVVEIKASIKENGSVTIEDNFFDNQFIFTDNTNFVDWLKERFYNR